jgi:predicted small lipoprotein YifL
MIVFRVLMRLVILIPLVILTGCGQKGRLYMEGHEPPSQKAVAKKRRADQAKQAQSGSTTGQTESAREEASDDGDKQDLPVLAPSAPN